MDLLNIIENPVVIGAFVSFLTFLYLKWKNDKDAKKYGKKQDVNLLIPFVIFLIVWFIAYAYFNSNEKCSIVVNIDAEHFIPTDNVNVINNDNSVPDIVKMDEFRLLGGGTTVPNKVPDILFELK